MEAKIFNLNFIKFSIVGFLGTITNLAIFFVFVDIFSINPNLVAIGAFLVAVTQNYLLNHLWTFNDITNNICINLKMYFKFLLTSLIGLLANIIILNLILVFINLKYKVVAQCIGILCGLFLNYINSKIFVFVRKKIE